MNKEIIDIIIPSSDKYMKYVSVLMVSILENINTNFKIFFHIVTEDISEKTKIKIDFLKRKYDFDIEYKYIDNSLISNLPACVNKYIDSNIYCIRLFLSSIFPDLKKVIILDGDTIVLEDLSRIWQIDLNNNCIAAVKDMWYKIKDYTGMQAEKGEYYINAGFLYANLDKWREFQFENKIKNIIPDFELQWPDQDLFNIIFKGRIYYLDWGWNFGPYIHKLNSNLLDNMEKQEILNCSKKIIHYMCREKPWQNFSNSYAEYFWYYARLSPYYEVLLQDKFTQKVELQETINYRRNKMKYRFYKVLSKITFGKSKERYKSKMQKWQKKVNVVRKLKRGW